MAITQYFTRINKMVIRVGFDVFSNGYVAGWRSTCKEMGLARGPDSNCELSIVVDTQFEDILCHLLIRLIGLSHT